MIENSKDKMIRGSRSKSKAGSKNSLTMKQPISIYDPVAKAYREVSQEDAEKFIASAKEAEEKLKSAAPEKKAK